MLLQAINIIYNKHSETKQKKVHAGKEAFIQFPLVAMFYNCSWKEYCNSYECKLSTYEPGTTEIEAELSYITLLCYTPRCLSSCFVFSSSTS